MKLHLIKVLGFVFLFQYGGIVKAQTNLPFWNDMQNFKKQDSVSFPAAGQVLFIGSSSFTMWRDVQSYFPKHKILNRAFGGSQLVDLIRYRYDVIFPYQPKQIVMYCGENDFAASDTVTVDIAVNRFKTLFALIRAKYPEVPFAYVSMKPSPSRKHLLKKYEAANDSIALWLSGHRKTKFVDVFHAMLGANGEPMTDIFLDDKLHMNAKGYAIWKQILLPVLKN